MASNVLIYIRALHYFRNFVNYLVRTIPRGNSGTKIGECKCRPKSCIMRLLIRAHYTNLSNANDMLFTFHLPDEKLISVHYSTARVSALESSVCHVPCKQTCRHKSRMPFWSVDIRCA